MSEAPRDHVSAAHDRERDVGRFESWAPRYDRSLLQPLFFRRLHSAAIPALSVSSGDRILDVGCGTGMLAADLVQLGARVDGIDPSEAMIVRARMRSLRGASFSVGRAEELRFRDAEFDAAVSVASAHHWHHPQEAFGELARVVKPGGRMVIVDTALESGAWVGFLRGIRRTDPHHHPGWAARELGDLLYQAGFVSVRGRRLSTLGGAAVILAAER